MNEYPRSSRHLELASNDAKTKFEEKMPPDAMHVSSVGKRIRRIKTREDINNLSKEIKRE